ncbi:MAG TPA: DUF167 domain-containing protein [Candidatus Nanoarchaeia archaeon]|nr:DUF167 domain-containing protein [Candidatus Nanoarchaeia archaeon]
MKTLHIKVIPNAKATRLEGDKLYIKEPPEKDKANKAVIKFFKKQGYRVVIKSGQKSRDKVISFLS